ncbi:MAG: hypothetical protein Q4G50_01825 [Corynebacterium sp.]|uniref:hypothetical protein n=1 Tax=Corynebacterium sp. TaxID=1720 RepID=UPI0026DFCAEB|nr:hypothetical protein [Corynebacterium sp.]MDO5668720.1 hypothetical protein [Corynebacterium sp.]
MLLGARAGTVEGMLIAEWIAAEIDAGRTALQPMLDSTPFDRAAVRTVAASGDFQIIDGHVRRSSVPSPGTWFPDREPTLVRSWSLPVVVTEDMLADAAVPLPLAIGSLVQVYRHGHRSFDSRLGPQAIMMDDTELRTGSIARFLRELDAAPGDTVHLRFDTNGSFDVSL